MVLHFLDWKISFFTWLILAVFKMMFLHGPWRLSGLSSLFWPQGSTVLGTWAWKSNSKSSNFMTWYILIALSKRVQQRVARASAQVSNGNLRTGQPRLWKWIQLNLAGSVEGNWKHNTRSESNWIPLSCYDLYPLMQCFCFFPRG